MKIFIEKQNKNLTRRFSGTVKALLQKLDINPETVIVVKDNELLIPEEKLHDKDSIKILSVISGG